MSYDHWKTTAPDPGTVADAETAEACPYCEARPEDRHHGRCPLRPVDTVTEDEIQFCDTCGLSYVTGCGCDRCDDTEGEDR